MHIHDLPTNKTPAKYVYYKISSVFITDNLNRSFMRYFKS